uniref:Uncharacterized protein n=1 Tax=Oryza barthii TaxID=65489 RepID=A0A0D3EXZ9_9ORYZ
MRGTATTLGGRRRMTRGLLAPKSESKRLGRRTLGGDGVDGDPLVVVVVYNYALVGSGRGTITLLSPADPLSGRRRASAAAARSTGTLLDLRRRRLRVVHALGRWTAGAWWGSMSARARALAGCARSDDARDRSTDHLLGEERRGELLLYERKSSAQEQIEASAAARSRG